MSETASKPTIHVIGANERLATQIATILERRNGGKNQWDIEDAVANATAAAKLAVQGATSTRSDRVMISSEINEFRGSQDSTNFAMKHLERKVTGLQADVASSRNNCLLWGIGGSCVSAIVMSMIFGPSSIPASVKAPQSAPQVRSAVVR